MGRIKTLLVKRITKKLIADFGDEFTEDYDKNKEVVSKHTSGTSPKIRNVIAGYTTRLIKQQKNPDKGQRSRSMKSEDLSKYYN
tara:strand:+ start:372 stop:623 length:252 start_codon:yes stop_codon:yes gene_type:complete